MTISVIISTYNGAHKIGTVINAVNNQTLKPEEVIVVVDGSSDNTLDVLNNLKIGLPSLQVVYQENKGRSAVRNAGANRAIGDLLVFFDDDMQPLEDCLEQHMKHHVSVPNSVLTGGLLEPVQKDSPDIVKFKALLSKKWNLQLSSGGGKLSKDKVFITAANFSICKEAFHNIGGFDERLTDAEDFDLAVRAFKAGMRLYFKEEAFAWHNDKFSCINFVKRQRQYAKAHEYLVDIKPWIATERFIGSVNRPKGWRKVVFQLFLYKFWISSVDNNYFRFLPQPVKYKLFDLIITANGVYYPEKVPL